MRSPWPWSSSTRLACTSTIFATTRSIVFVSRSDRCPPVWSPVLRRRLRLSRSSESQCFALVRGRGDVSQRARPHCRDRGLRSLAQDEPAQPAADGRCPCPCLHHRRARCCRDAPDQLLLWAGLLFAYIVGLTAIAKAEAGSGLAGYWPAALLALPAVAFVAETPDPASWLLLALFVGWSACRLVCRRPAQHRPRGRLPPSPASRSWMRWPWRSLVP